MIKKIIKYYKDFLDLFKDKYTQEVSIDTVNQCYVYKCFKNGEYTHSVNVHYYTEEQIQQFQNIVAEYYEKNT